MIIKGFKNYCTVVIMAFIFGMGITIFVTDYFGDCALKIMECEAKAADINAYEWEKEWTGLQKQMADGATAVLKKEITFNDKEECINVELKGGNMGVLIGKRGQTLDSLQYLTNLAINKQSENYYRVKIDTEDYRKRRRETLENLAKNISFKVKRTKRPVSLEPMNPFERRVIHSALQNDRFVETHSEGDEPYRHVVVTLKK